MSGWADRFGKSTGFSESRFKANSALGVSPFGAADVMRASASDYGGFLRHSSGGSGGCSSPAVPGSWFLGGVWMAGLLLCQVVRGRGTKRPGEEEVQRVSPRLWSCCPDCSLMAWPGSESRCPVRHQGGGLGSGLVGRDPPGLRDQSSLILRPGLVAVAHSSSGAPA